MSRLDAAPIVDMVRPMIRPNDIVYTADKRMARVLRVTETSDGHRALLRSYPGRRPMGHHDVLTLEGTSLLTFMLDEQDTARLRELQRLSVLADSREKGAGWSPSRVTRAGLARDALSVMHCCWADDPLPWIEEIEDQLHECDRVRSGDLVPLRLRLPVSLRSNLFELADETRHSTDQILRACVMHRLTIIVDMAPIGREDVYKKRRLCVYPPGLELRAASLDRWDPPKAKAKKVKGKPPPLASVPVTEDAEQTQDAIGSATPVSVTVLGGLWAEDGDGIRSASSAAESTAAKGPA